MVLRKTVCIFLMCILLLPGGLFAPTAKAEELIVSDSFENITKWTLSSQVSRNTDSGNVRTGNTSVKFTRRSSGKVGSDLTARMTIRNIEGGAEYTFGVWVKTAESMGVRFRYRCFDENESILHDGLGNAAYEGASGANWYYFSEAFRVPRETNYMYVYVRMHDNGNGKVAYCDDFTMHLTDGPEMFYDFKTDGTFYYSERTKDAEVSATVDTAFYDKYIGQPVEFSLISEDKTETKLGSASVPADGKVHFTFPLSALKEKKKPYTLQCTFAPPGADAVVKTHTIYKYDRPKHIDGDGFFRDENDNIFTPSIMFGASLSGLDDFITVGANAVQGYPSKDWLDALHAKNMKCLVVLFDSGRGVSAGHESRVGVARAYANEYKDHPAVFGWQVYDEPEYTDETEIAELERAYRAIREVDDAHPIVITANSGYAKLSQYVDAIIQDSYPYNNTLFTTYPYERNVEAVAEAQDRPVYHLMQTFEYNNSFPKPQEVRNMQYASLWAGAKGYGYYKYLDYKYDGVSNLSSSNLWQTMIDYAKEEEDIVLDIFVYNKYQKIKEENTSSYQWGIWKTPDGYYLILRNKKYNASISPILPIDMVHGGWKIKSIGKAPDFMRTRIGGVSVTLAAGDVALMYLTPSDEASPISLFETDANAKFTAYTSTANSSVFGVNAYGELWLTSSSSKNNPRILYTFPEANKPKANIDYVLSFLFKPEEEENYPVIRIGKNDPYQNVYFSFWGNEDYFRKEEKEDGWYLYTVSFVLPEVDATENVAVMIASYGGCANGLYDNFALYEDSAFTRITDGRGEPFSEVKNGMEIRALTHLVTDKKTSGKVVSILAVYTDTKRGKELVAIDVGDMVVQKNKPILDANGDTIFYASADENELSVTVPESGGPYIYKLMRWNETMQSLFGALPAI